MKAKYFDLTNNGIYYPEFEQFYDDNLDCTIFQIMPTPCPDIYEKEKARQWVKKLDSVNPHASEEVKQRYSWFGYGGEL
jgi:hypothetical protein